MSAWPEAVWTVKKLKTAIYEAFDLIEELQELNEKLVAAETQLNNLDDAVNNNEGRIDTANINIQAISDEIDNIDISGLMAEITAAEQRVTNAVAAANARTDAKVAEIDQTLQKAPIIVAKNSSIQPHAHPQPDSDLQPSAHSVFLIEYGDD